MELSPSQAGKIHDEAVCQVAEAAGYVRAIEPYLLDTQPVYDYAVYCVSWARLSLCIIVYSFRKSFADEYYRYDRY